MAKYKEILTVEQLLDFCEKQNFSYFSSKESGYQLAVKVPTTFEEVSDIDENHCGMMKLKFRIFHTGLNRNGSYVSENAAKKAMKTIADRPVLAAIHQLDDGSFDFEGHEMIVVENENGCEELEYIESQVGSFSSEPAFWEYDEELDKNYVCAYAYISEEYTKAAEIIRKKNGTKNSCELFINELSYNAKEKYLELNDFFVNGSTLLGKRSDGTEIGEGMLGSRADIVDFSVENNSVKYSSNNKLIETLERLNKTLSEFTINKNFGKEEVQVDNEELLEEVTDEVVDEVVEEMSTEEVTEDVTETEETTEEEVTVEEEFSDDTTDDEVAPEEDTNDEETVEESEEVIEEPVVEQNCLKYSVECGELKKDFSLSLNEKIYALQELINETYSELDNDYFMVDVYDEDKLVVFHGWSGKSYRQSFKCKKDSYSLVGDRIEVYAQYLTQDEITALDKMRNSYAEIETKLAKYEAEPQKMEILNSDDYSQIAETEEFVALKAQDAHFDMSVDELTVKCDEMLLSYAKTQKIDFSAKEQKVVKPMGLPTIKASEQKKRYGNLFNK